MGTAKPVSENTNAIIDEIHLLSQYLGVKVSERELSKQGLSEKLGELREKILQNAMDKIEAEKKTGTEMFDELSRNPNKVVGKDERRNRFSANQARALVDFAFGETDVNLVSVLAANQSFHNLIIPYINGRLKKNFNDFDQHDIAIIVGIARFPHPKIEKELIQPIAERILDNFMQAKGGVEQEKYSDIIASVPAVARVLAEKIVAETHSKQILHEQAIIRLLPDPSIQREIVQLILDKAKKQESMQDIKSLFEYKQSFKTFFQDQLLEAYHNIDNQSDRESFLQNAVLKDFLLEPLRENLLLRLMRADDLRPSDEEIIAKDPENSLKLIFDRVNEDDLITIGMRDNMVRLLLASKVIQSLVATIQKTAEPLSWQVSLLDLPSVVEFKAAAEKAQAAEIKKEKNSLVEAVKDPNIAIEKTATVVEEVAPRSGSVSLPKATPRSTSSVASLSSIDAELEAKAAETKKEKDPLVKAVNDPNTTIGKAAVVVSEIAVSNTQQQVAARLRAVPPPKAPPRPNPGVASLRSSASGLQPTLAQMSEHGEVKSDALPKLKGIIEGLNSKAIAYMNEERGIVGAEKTFLVRHRMQADIQKKVYALSTTNEALVEIWKRLQQMELKKGIGSELQALVQEKDELKIIIRKALLADEEAHGLFSRAGRVRTMLNTTLDELTRWEGDFQERTVKQQLSESGQQDQAIMLYLIEKFKTTEPLPLNASPLANKYQEFINSYEQIKMVTQDKELEAFRKPISDFLYHTELNKMKNINSDLKAAKEIFAKLSPLPKPGAKPSV